MKFNSVALGLMATAASFVAAVPAKPELDTRILCIGCITDGGFCLDKSEPKRCNDPEGDGDPNECTLACIYTSASGCRCCPFDNGELTGDCYDAN